MAGSDEQAGTVDPADTNGAEGMHARAATTAAAAACCAVLYTIL